MQSTLGSTVGPVRAADFTPIVLPQLDSAHLEHAVLADGRPQGSPDFELQYDPSPMSFLYPHESKLMRTVTVKNNGHYATLQVGATITPPGASAINVERASIPPMPGGLYLEPGESQLIWVTVYLEALDRSRWRAGESYEYRIDVYVAPEFGGPFDLAVVRPGTQIAKLANTVRVVDTAPDSRSVPRNAAISGCVYDGATRKPLANAQVTFAAGSFLPQSVATDPGGSYRVELIADRGALTGMWRTWGVTIKAPGYRELHGAVAPHDGDRLVLDAPLARATETASYVLKAKIDTGGLNIVAGAISRDGRYLATVPFHSAVPPGVDAQQFLGRAQLSFFDTAGVLLWQFPLYDETTAVAISDDGSLVATSRANPVGRASGSDARSDSGVYLLDNKGNVVWYFRDPAVQPLPFYEVRISHAKQYLAAGDLQGHLYLLDISSKRIAWRRFVGGQVRELEFDEADGTLFVGSEDGYLYAFGIDGTVKWRTYVGGFPTGLAFSEHYIMTAGKEGHFASLLDRSGKLLWEYPIATSPHFVAIAPDESYLLAEGGGVGFRTIALDPGGVLLYQLDPVAQVPFISADSAHIVRVGFSGLPGAKRTIWAEVTDRTGSVLWRNDTIGSTDQGESKGFAWLSPDATRLVVAFGESVFFFEGAITAK